MTTYEPVFIYQFITNNHASFHLRWKKYLLNNQRVSTINMIVVIDFDFFYRSCRFRTQTFKLSLTSCSPSCASSMPRLFRIIGKLEAKKIIENIFQTIKLDNAIQLFVAIKGSFSDLFFWTSQSKGEFPGNYLINVTTCLFAHH